jgi:hypothetical protein
MTLKQLSNRCRSVIERAEADGVQIDDGNVVDLIADNVRVPLGFIRQALSYAGYSSRFPNAVKES